MHSTGFSNVKDLAKFIIEEDFKILNLCHIADDRRLKTLSFFVRDEKRVKEILEFGERVDGSSLFSSIEAGKSDVYIMPKLDKTFLNPFVNLKTLNVLCDYLDGNGKALDIAPQSILTKAQEKLHESSGIELCALAELEFYVVSKYSDNAIFRGEPEKNYHESAPFSKFEGLRNDILNLLGTVGIDTKYAHGEVGRILGSDGSIMEQHEIELLPEKLADMADTVAITKWIIRNACAMHGVEVSFSPKIALDHAGTGMHIHLCGLRNGRNIIPDTNGELSGDALKMIGGIMKFAASLSAFGNTTPVSYLRFVASKESPMNICWGARNRLALVRIPLWWSYKRKTEASTDCTETFEYRAPDPLADVCLLFSGLALAVQNGLANAKESTKLAEELHVDSRRSESHEILRGLPRSCVEAADCLEYDRQFYEADDVFPKRTIDRTIERLRSYADTEIWQKLVSNPHEFEAILAKFWNYG